MNIIRINKIDFFPFFCQLLHEKSLLYQNKSNSEEKLPESKSIFGVYEKLLQKK